MLKALAFQTLRLSWINRLIRVARHPIRLLARGRAWEIPIRGKAGFEVGANVTAQLYSDGRDSIASAIFWGRTDEFEPETVKTVAALAPSIRTFVDIGANTGIYSVLVARVNPRARVYAFEPVVGVFSALARKIQVNRLGNVLPFCQAIEDQRGARSCT